VGPEIAVDAGSWDAPWRERLLDNFEKDLFLPLTFTAADVTIKYGDNGAASKASQFIDANGIIPLAGDSRAPGLAARFAGCFANY
jgi:hypothetical protein